MLLGAQQGSIEEHIYLAYQLGVVVSEEKINLLNTENTELKTEITTLKSENTALQDEIERLKEQLGLARQRQFGKKTESQGNEPSSEENVSPSIPVRAHTRKKKTKGRLIDVSALPRHRIIYDLPEHNKYCSCCQQPLKYIGQDTSERIEVIPQRLYVEEHVRYKYACLRCQTVHMAPKEKSPLPKAMAGAGLLTDVIVNKYHYHLPLYRQSKLFASYGALIPDNTLGHWVMQLGRDLYPVYEALFVAVLISRYIQVDETPVKLLQSDKKGYVWSYLAPHVGGGLVAFEVNKTRKAHVVETRLAPYEGLLQTDGYSGYQGLREQTSRIVGLACLTHARRKFAEAFKLAPDPEGIAAQALARLQPLYALEARMRAAKYSFHTRKRLRQAIAWPLLKDFRRWLKQVAPQVPPKSQLGKAILYTLNQWPYLIKYLRHGQAEIDTNGIENKIREIALGRKNWLFMANEDTGIVHATFYSLILSATLNALNPRIYLHYLLTHIHDLRQKKIDPHTLLPHTVDRQQLDAFAKQLINHAKEVLHDF